MDNPEKVSIKRSFLDRVYRRKSEGPLLETFQFDQESQDALTSVHCSSFMSKNTQISKEGHRRTKTSFNNRSKTPSLIKPENGFHTFSSFLTNLLKFGLTEENLDLCQGVSDSLSYYFTNDSDFSMDLYLAITGILKYLQHPEEVMLERLNFKVNEALKLLPAQKISSQGGDIINCIEKLNLRVVNSLKRVVCLNEDLINLFNAFLVLFTEIEKDYMKIPLKKLQGEKVVEIIQKYLQTPGKMIQLCRKFPDYVKNGQVSEEYVRFTEGLLFKTRKKVLISLDSLGGVLIFYNFLEACVQYFYENSRPMLKISLMRNSSQELVQKAENCEKMDEKYSKLDEALNLTKEILAQPYLTTTPLKGRKSSLFLNMIESRFKDFLKKNIKADISSESKRLVLFEVFERTIMDEVRHKALTTAAECYKPNWGDN